VHADARCAATAFLVVELRGSAASPLSVLLYNRGGIVRSCGVVAAGGAAAAVTGGAAAVSEARRGVKALRRRCCCLPAAPPLRGGGAVTAGGAVAAAGGASHTGVYCGRNIEPRGCVIVLSLAY
jgi:hypothetical protein